MFLAHKHRRKHLKVTTELSLIKLILALGMAGIETVWVLYMNAFNLSESSIGFISAGLVLISLITAFYSTPILEKFNEKKVLIYSLIGMALSGVILAIYVNFYFFIFLAVLLTIFSVFRLDSFDILFRDEAKTKELNGDEGLMYALTNVGWLVGPLIAGFVMVQYGLKNVFISSAIFILISVFILIKLNFKLPEKKRKEIDSHIFKNIGEFIKNKKLLIAYSISAGIEIWWALIYVYVPLFIIKNGLDEGTVGLFLSAIVIPLVLFEYEIGKLSERYGFRNFFVFGFFLIGLFAIAAYFSSNIYLTLFILVLASIPMSLLEPLQDSYFFKQIRKIDEEKFFPIYGTATHIGSFISKFVIAGFLLFFTESFTYILMAVFMFLIGIICLKIKD